MEKLLQSKGVNYLIDLAGGEGKYQIKTISLLIFIHQFRAFWLLYYPFLTQAPLFLCEDPDNPGSTYECTELTGGCVDQRISENSPSSLAIDLGLYCDQAYVRTIGSTLFFLGGNIGAGYYSYLSDAKGRKTALRYCYLMGSLSYLFLGTLAVGPLTYMLGVMAVWGNFSSFTTLSITYSAEISNEKFATDASLIILLGVTFGELLVVLLAYLIPSWRTLFIFFMVIPALLANFLFKFLDESPVFLHGKGETEQTLQIIKKMAEVNGTQLDTGSPKSEVKPSIAGKMSVSPVSVKPKRSWNYFTIMIHPKLRLRVFIFSILKFYLNMAFFGCIFALSSLGGSIFTNSVIAGVAEGLGYILALKAYLFSTKKLLKGGLQIVVATGISFLLVPTLSCEGFFICSPIFIQGVLAFAMRTALCFICGFMCNVGNQLFPPEVRSQSIGISEIFACIGGMVAPFVIVAAEVNHLSPLFLFGTIGFFALSASKYLPETQLTSMDDDNQGMEMSYMKMSEKEN